MSAYELADSFLDKIYSKVNAHATRPFITLTFAQSIDGKIATKDRRQLILSGDESMVMTHRLRTLHEGILVGIGTALADDPQLNARRLDPSVLQNYAQPYPIVLDPRLELPLSCKLLRNYQKNTGKQPWLITTSETYRDRKESYDALKAAGARIFTAETQNGRIVLEDVYRILRENGIHRLMVEGGANVIRSCLESHVDQLIVTIAPTLVGDGLMATGGNIMPKLCDIQYQQFGRDIVMAAKFAE